MQDIKSMSSSTPCTLYRPRWNNVVIKYESQTIQLQYNLNLDIKSVNSCHVLEQNLKEKWRK